MSTISSVMPPGDAVAGTLCVEKDGQHSQSAQPENIETMTTAELSRLSSEFGINIVNRSKRQRARYRVLGRRRGTQRIHLLLNYEDEVDAIAQELATVPGQAPVAVIDTDDCGAVTFYFADGGVSLVARKPWLLTESKL